MMEKKKKSSITLDEEPLIILRFFEEGSWKYCEDWNNVQGRISTSVVKSTSE